jgi:hypothetical protein
MLHFRQRNRLGSAEKTGIDSSIRKRAETKKSRPEGRLVFGG